MLGVEGKAKDVNPFRMLSTGSVNEEEFREGLFHDLIKLGEYREALILHENPINELNSKRGIQEHQARSEAIRLPLLLHLLSMAQPLSGIPRLLCSVNDYIKKESSDIEEAKEMEKTDLSLRYSRDIDEIVLLLEQVVCKFPAAEELDRLYATLVCPSIRWISKCVPIKRRNKNMKGFHRTSEKLKSDAGGFYDTSSRLHSSWDLEKLMTNWENHKNQSSTITLPTTATKYQDRKDDRMEISEDEQDDLEMENHCESQTSHAQKGHFQIQSDAISEVTRTSDIQSLVRGNRMLSELLPAVNDSKSKNMKSSSPYVTEESPSTMTERVLSDLVSMVVSSLGLIHPPTRLSSNLPRSEQQERDKNIMDTNVNGNNIHVHQTSEIALTLNPDSLFVEDSIKYVSGKDNTLGFHHNNRSSDDLSSTVIFLLHRAPVLRHNHVANALCRSRSPQAPLIIERMVANCPTASQAILRGCLDAYHAVELDSSIDDTSHQEILNIVKNSLGAIAALSASEASHVISILHSSACMPDVMVGLMMKIDPVNALVTLIEELSPIIKDQLHSFHSTQSSRWERRMKKKNRKVKRTFRRKIRRQRSFSALAQMEKKTCLADALLADKNFSDKIRKFILLRMIDLGNGTHEAWGESLILIQASALFIYHVGIGAGSSIGSGSMFVEESMKAISALVQRYDDCKVKLEAYSNNVIPGDPSIYCGNDFVKFAICSCLIMCLKFPPIVDSNNNHDTPSSAPVMACETCLSDLLSSRYTKLVELFSSSIRSFLSNHRPLELRALVLSTLVNKEFVSSEGFVTMEHDKFSRVCQWAKPIIKSTISVDKDLHKAMMILDTIGTNYERREINEEDEFVKASMVLFDLDNMSRISRMKRKNLVALCHVMTLYMTTNKSMSSICPIRRLDLEVLARKVFGVQQHPESSHEARRRQFLIRLLSALFILDQVPDSPYTIDPRELPIGEVLKSFLNPTDYIWKCLICLVSKHCPETIDQYYGTILMETTISFKKTPSPSIIGNAICDLLANSGANKNLVDNVTDSFVECMFIRSCSLFPRHDVFVEATKALLKSTKIRISFITYSALCKDPLILLKCSIKVWRCEGLRRIALYIMSGLLATNEVIIRKQVSHSDIAHEYLSSRDVLFTRCLIFLGSGCIENLEEMKLDSIQCSMMIHILRYTVARRPGLITVIFRQGLPNAAIDWFVDCVPETLSDANFLMKTLEINIPTGNYSVSVSTAYAAIRIAIVQGTSRNDLAQKLSYSAFSVLVSSFYHILNGGMGLPVNVIREDKGYDKLKSCREIIFRVLSLMQRIQGDCVGVRNEAKLALSKMAAICKKENAGTTRKQELKEMWEAINKAISILDLGS